MFGLVCCPHYFFEIASWAGVALVVNHFAAVVLVWTMSCYLFGRAHSTLGWYTEKAKQDKLDKPLPRGWKRIVPFLF